MVHCVIIISLFWLAKGVMSVLDHNSMTPLYMQIASWLETEILKGNFKKDEKIYSQYQLADLFQINPATAARGLTLLGEHGILYDRRGLGKFVAADAVEIIKTKRKNDVIVPLIDKLVTEAKYLEINQETLIGLIETSFREIKGGRKDD